MTRPGKSTALATLTTAALIAGCGSSTNGTNAPKGNAPAAAGAGQNAIARAAFVSTQASGYKFAMSLQEGSPALGGQISGSGTGSFNLARHAGQINLNMKLPGAAASAGNLAIREVIDGQNVFLALPATIAAHLPGGKPWIELNLSKLGGAAGVSGLSSLTGGAGGTDPAQFLSYLRAASPGGVKQLGTATVNGVATTHYHGTVELARAAAQVPAAERVQAEQAIAQIQKLTKLTQLPVDVYVDARNLVRRLDLAYKATVKGQSIATAIRLDFLAYGPQPIPATPPAGQVTDLTSLLGGLKSLG
jgi:hypothetical protein